MSELLQEERLNYTGDLQPIFDWANSFGYEPRDTAQ